MKADSLTFDGSKLASYELILTKGVNGFRREAFLIAAREVARSIAKTPFSVHVEEEHNDQDAHPQSGSKNRRFH